MDFMDFMESRTSETNWIDIFEWIGNMNSLLKHTAFKTQISFSEVLGLDLTGLDSSI